jgi:uncharacterized repeat protein (TIGR03803 family)
MTKLNGWKSALAVLLLCAATAMVTHAQVFTTLVVFDDYDGNLPNMSFTQGRDGNLYGTTFVGAGARQNGTLFRMTFAGDLRESLPLPGSTGASKPLAGLVQGLDRNFYGTTYWGGQYNFGTIFKVDSTGAITVLHSFCAFENCFDGGGPWAPLIQATDGNLYGTTSFGTIFRVTPSGEFTNLYTFNNAGLYDALVEGTDGNLYGTTGGYDSYGVETIFKLTLAGNLTTLYTFPGEPGPEGGLIQATDGNFYGTTIYGGTNGKGSAYKITPTGTLTTLYMFCAQPSCSDGSYPYAGLVQGTDSNFYGTTREGGTHQECSGGCGTIFKLTPQGVLTTLHAFRLAEGVAPESGLYQATNGIFYGATPYAGNLKCPRQRGGCGTIYSLDVGLGPFVTFVRFAGRVGRTGPILGQGLTGTTSVSINGIQANFTVVTDTLIRATVPPGATTGYVSVTTPSGTLTSSVPFHVIP